MKLTNEIKHIKKLESVKAEQVCMQYNISESKVLFLHFVIIALGIDSLLNLLLCSVGHQAWICL